MVGKKFRALSRYSGLVIMKDNMDSPKVCGKRSFARGLGVEANDGFFRLVLSLRGEKPFIPRGLFRFKSFEESDAWLVRVMSRTSKRDRRQ